MQTREWTWLLLLKGASIAGLPTSFTMSQAEQKASARQLGSLRLWHAMSILHFDLIVQLGSTVRLPVTSEYKDNL